MTLIGRRFGLSTERGRGIFCGEDGLFIGGVPILERVLGNSTSEQWRPRPAIDLNRDLSNRYGLPAEINSRLECLAAIGRALDRGDLVHAMMVSLHLDLPDPPDRANSTTRYRGSVDSARSLKASGLLKADWDPSKHPRWPAGSAESIGGEFAPASSTGGASDTADALPEFATEVTLPVRLDTQSGIPLTPVNATTFPIPFGIPGFSLPSEIAPAPVLPPNVNPIYIPRNPYPGRPKCVREWVQAKEDCVNLWADGLLGTDDYRGMGNTIAECMMGRVSQDCGGNRYDT